jgi:hypothetical protein
MVQLSKIGLAACLAVMIAGCGGDGDAVTNTPNPRVRFANVMPGIASARAQVGPDVISSNIPFGTVSNYAITPNGTKDLTVGDSTFDNLATLADQLFELDRRYTGIGFGTGPRQILLLEENESVAPSDTVALKFVHADQTEGNVDVYVYLDGASLPAAPSFANMAPGTIAPAHVDLPVNSDPANVRITVYPAGSTTGALVNQVVSIPRRDRVAIVFYDTGSNSALLSLKQNLD